MDVGISFVMASLLFSFLIAIVYFTKNRVKNHETFLYSCLFITSIIGCIIAIPLYFVVKDYTNFNFFTYFLPRAYMVFISIWTYILTVYFTLISKKNSLKLFRFFSYVFIPYVAFNSFLAFTLPIDYYSQDGIVYTAGPAVNAGYIICGLEALYIAIGFIKNFKMLKNKKAIPFIVVFFLGLGCVIIQKINPAIRLITSLFAFASHVMYFTIENPDVKMLEEFKIAKDIAEKANEEKEMFLYNITQDIRTPLQEIKKASVFIKENVKTLKQDDINDGMYYIDKNASNVLNVVNNVLDITDLEITNIKVYNNKYDINNIATFIRKIFNSRINNKVNFRISIDSDIPKHLYGDAIRLKQIFEILIDNSIKNTKDGFIELRINSIIKKDICRLIINIEDSGTGIKPSELDRILNKDNLYTNEKVDDSKSTIVLAKSIVNLLGGVLLIDSELGSGTKMTIVLDQKIYNENETSKKIVNDVDKFISNPKVMIVVEEDEYREKVLKKLSRYNLDLEVVELGSKCLDNIRLSKKYDLIIMDESLSHLSSIEIITKLKAIPSFDTPVTLLTDNTDNKGYINNGFTYLLDKKIPSKELEDIIDKIERSSK